MRKSILAEGKTVFGGDPDGFALPIEVIRAIAGYHDACRAHYYRRGSFGPDGDVLEAERRLRSAIADSLKIDRNTKLAKRVSK